MRTSLRISFYYLRMEWRRSVLTMLAIAAGLALFPLLSGLLAEADRPGSMHTHLHQGLSFIAGLIALSLASLAVYHHMAILLRERAGELAMLRVSGHRKEDILQLLYFLAGMLITAGALLGGLGGAIPFAMVAASLSNGDHIVSDALFRGYAAMLLLGLPVIAGVACIPIQENAKRDFVFHSISKSIKKK